MRSGDGGIARGAVQAVALSGRKALTRGAVAAAVIFAAGLLAGCEDAKVRIANIFDPLAASELKATATNPKVKAFYERRQWRQAWEPGRMNALLKELEGATAHGLDPSAFVRLIKSARGRAAHDAELTLAALTYGEALARGAVDPRRIHSIYTLDRPPADLAASLDRAVESGDIAGWLAGLAPQDAEYKALSSAYLDYQARAKQAVETPIPPGATTRPGGRDPRVPAIAQRLREEGYLLAATDPAAEVLSAPVSQALKVFQADEGLKKDGAITDATVAALNAVPADRARQLAVNLERRRWLARDPAATWIDVNTAAAKLVYLRDGKVAWRSNTVVGRPGDSTPALGESFKQLVVNPPWNVPSSIAEKEIFPKGPGYLERNNMYVENGKVVQRPGPQTALGAVKFDMQNRYNIYLHDTPAKSLFGAAERHRSHGCVRVEKAVEFARLLAADHGKTAAFDEALASGETKVVELGASIPVRLLYHTAYLDEQGRLAFAEDAYGWDEKLGEALGFGQGRRRGGTLDVAALLGP